MLWLNRMVLGNTVLRWAISFLVGAGGSSLLWLAKERLQGRLTRGAGGGPLARVLAHGLAHVHLGIVLALFIPLGAKLLDLPPLLERLLDHCWPLALWVQVAVWGHAAIGLWSDRRFASDASQDGVRASRAAILGFLLRLALWSLVLLLALDGLGYNVTTLLASLGIGGIAVALAVQNILGDLFASLSIALDRPFVIGDFIIVDDCLGTVEHIGLKSTRIHSLSGEQIILANNDLLKSRIRNYKKLVERRVVFGFAVSDRTPLAKLARIPAWTKEIIEAQPMVRFDRSNLKEFGPSGLTFENVFYVLSGDYNVFMNIQEAIHLGLLETLDREGIRLSFPTRVLEFRDPAQAAARTEPEKGPAVARGARVPGLKRAGRRRPAG